MRCIIFQKFNISHVTSWINKVTLQNIDLSNRIAEPVIYNSQFASYINQNPRSHISLAHGQIIEHTKNYYTDNFIFSHTNNVYQSVPNKNKRNQGHENFKNIPLYFRNRSNNPIKKFKKYQKNFQNTFYTEQSSECFADFCKQRFKQESFEHLEGYDNTYSLKIKYLENLKKNKILPNLNSHKMKFLYKKLKPIDHKFFRTKLELFFKIKSQHYKIDYNDRFNIIKFEILEKFYDNYYNAILFLIYYDFFSMNFKRMNILENGDLEIEIYNNNIRPSILMPCLFKTLMEIWDVNQNFDYGYEIFDKLIELFIDTYKKLPHDVLTTGKRYIEFKINVLSNLYVFLGY